MHHYPMGKSRNKERCINCCYTGVLSSCRMSPALKSRKSQHNTTAPGSAQRCTQGSAGFSQLGFIQLLVFKDTVALFQYPHGLWGIFKKLPIRQIPSAQYYSLAC